MPFEQPPAALGWSARLALAFAARDGRTVLAQRRHEGPLVVQKPLYPEGARVCHAIIVHPPAGMVGGDALDIAVDAGDGVHALVTTPGAGKWYGSRGLRATQRVAVRGCDGSVVEWLPQEAILFDGTRARMEVDVTLAGAAVFVGMEIICFGRTATGERFADGEVVFSTRIARDGALLWCERGDVRGDSPLLNSPVGLASQPVVGTLIAASPRVNVELLAQCREEAVERGRGAVTLLPGLLVARYLGPACEPARAWLGRVWSRLRPALTGRAAMVPRIWNT